MKVKELKIGIILGLILILRPTDFSGATTILNDGGSDVSILCYNSNSIVIDNIEYYIQTDKSTYNLGDDIKMLYRITNLSGNDVSIRCYHIPPINLLVRKNNLNIWSKYKSFLGTFTSINISDGDFIDNTFTWDMYDYNDNLIEPGIYDIVGITYNVPPEIEVAVPITVIPEPITLVLLTTGSLVFIRKKRGKRILKNS